MLKLQKLNSQNLEIAKHTSETAVFWYRAVSFVECRKIAHSGKGELLLPASKWPHVQMRSVSKSDNTPVV